MALSWRVLVQRQPGDWHRDRLHVSMRRGQADGAISDRQMADR